MEAGVLRCASCGAAVGEHDVQCPYCRSQLATVACPACFGLVSVGARHCPHCGTALAAVAAVPSGRGCPECRLPLEAGSLGGVAFESCPQCGGLWLDQKPFETLAADRQVRGDALGVLPGEPPRGSVCETGVRYRPCPACGKLMNRANYARISGVVVDTCKEHGLWFDRDELRRVLAFIEAGGLEKARTRQIQELEDRQRRAAAPLPLEMGGEEPSLSLGDLFKVAEGLLEKFRHPTP